MIPPPSGAPNPDSPIASLDDRARQDLRFIRQTMERGPAFTGVPGWGGVGMGILALGASALSWNAPTPRAWILPWLATAALAVGVGGLGMVWKARRAGAALLPGAGRRFFLSFLPAIAAGAVLTLALWAEGHVHLLPGSWLLLYGAAVLSAGTFSIRAVPLMGGGFFFLGCVAFLTPATWNDALMALGFGGLHIAFGVHIGRHHGG